MKILLALTTVSILAAQAIASSNAPSFPKENAKAKQEKDDAYYQKTGGLIPPPKNAKHLLIIDAREFEIEPSLSNNTVAAESMLSLGIDLKKTVLKQKVSPREFAFNAKKAGAGAVVLFYESSDEPTEIVFPQDGITLINVKPLMSDFPDKLWYHRRIMTEFWRGIAFSLGGYGIPPPMGGASMQPLFSQADYYSLTSAGLSPVQISAIAKAKSKLGICDRKLVPYSRACREGWAPPPTNDVQKAIWDKVHEIPSKPIKIEYNEKRDKGK